MVSNLDGSGRYELHVVFVSIKTFFSSFRPASHLSKLVDLGLTILLDWRLDFVLLCWRLDFVLL